MGRFRYGRRAAATLLALAALLGAGRTPPAGAGERGDRAAIQAQVVAALGQPDAFVYAVSRLAAARSRFAAATGSQFAATTESSAQVEFPESRTTRRIRFRRASSVRGTPFVEFVEASPPVGPWSADPTRATFSLSYTVRNVKAFSTSLQHARMRLVAEREGSFAFWRGVGGLSIRLVERSPVSQARVGQAPASIDLGPPAAVTYSPCKPAALTAQLTTGLGIQWVAPRQFALRYEFTDGTRQDITTTVDISEMGSPFLVVEVPFHAPPSYACTAAHTPVFPIFVTDDVAAAADQITRAGMPMVARVPGLISLHEAAGGTLLEVVHSSFLAATQ